MEPIVSDVEAECNVKFRTINVSRKPDVFRLMLESCPGGEKCNMYPFYYNRKTGKAVCGPTYYDNLKALVLGEESTEKTRRIKPSADAAERQREYEKAQVRQPGMWDYLKEKLSQTPEEFEKLEGKDV